MTGRDSKGREKRLYSNSHDMQASAAKFGRVSELRKKRDKIFKEVDSDIRKDNKTEEALVTKLIMKTGMRPGSDVDTKSDYKSYGATTLEGRHVVQNSDGSVSLKFVPGKKKGKEIEMPVHDSEFGKQLLERSRSVGPEGRMFHTTAEKVRNYSKSKDGGGFKTKDHRTALGTDTAVQLIETLAEPKNLKEYKSSVKNIAEKVSNLLGNTPSIALKAYIDPHVFSVWKSKLGM